MMKSKPDTPIMKPSGSRPEPNPSADRLSSERGMALVMVLGFVALFAVLASMVVASTRVTNITSKVNTDRSNARYAAESTLAYTMWMVVDERRKFSGTRILGRLPPPDQLEAPSWTADGAEHTPDISPGMSVSVKIYDAVRGLDISGRNPGDRLLRDLVGIRNTVNLSDEDLTEREEAIVHVADVLNDYVDADRLTRLNGMEDDGYMDIGLEHFPRNGYLRMSEEIYWIAKIEGLLPSGDGKNVHAVMPENTFRVITPPRMATAPNPKPSFFSSTPAMIQSAAKLTDEELEDVLKAREAWLTDSIPLAESIPALYSRVSGAMSIRESGIYTFDVRVRAHGSGGGRRIIATIDLRTMSAAGRPPILSWWHIRIE